MKQADDARHNSMISITATAANHSGKGVKLGPLRSSSHFQASIQCFSLKKFSLTNTRIIVHLLKYSSQTSIQ